ncbi:MAG: DUF3883 domain-containing protein [Saprospiraceae bacterium]|nr:DUF3883 domain-containing protein [Saprospiraceae bacterium]
MSNWSNYEVELIVADYFKMLSDELSGNSYKKSEHRKALLPLLNNRSEGSIEFKHQNISAILVRLGQPYVKGYLPRYNYQKILEDVVVRYLSKNLWIEDKFRYFADKDVHNNPTVNFELLLLEPPILWAVNEPAAPSYQRSPIKINYLEREQRNHKLGESGEQVVFNYEKWVLKRNGKESLAEQVKWVSKEEGDGAGFDILSKNLNGTDKYIEVKTTKLGKETPFFFSRNELLFSQNHDKNYHLFRLFNFDSNAKMFTKTGSLDTICNSTPVLFEGYF